MSTEPWIFIDNNYRQLIGFTERYGRLYAEGRLRDEQMIEVQYLQDGQKQKVKFKFGEFRIVQHERILKEFVEYII